MTTQVKHETETLALHHLKMLVECASNDRESKQILGCILFDGNTAQSCDGHRAYSVPCKHELEPFIVLAKDLKRFLKGAKKISWHSIPRELMLNQYSYGTFPDLNLLIPKKINHSLPIISQLETTFCNAVNEASTDYVAIRIANKQLQIMHGYESELARDWRWFDPINFDYEYHDLSAIIFKQEYLKAIANFPFNKIDAVDNLSPVLFHGLDKNFLLIMPFVIRQGKQPFGNN
jgi:hypothetical protein